MARYNPEHLVYANNRNEVLKVATDAIEPADLNIPSILEGFLPFLSPLNVIAFPLDRDKKWIYSVKQNDLNKLNIKAEFTYNVTEDNSWNFSLNHLENNIDFSSCNISGNTEINIIQSDILSADKTGYIPYSLESKLVNFINNKSNWSIPLKTLLDTNINLEQYNDILVFSDDLWHNRSTDSERILRVNSQGFIDNYYYDELQLFNIVNINSISEISNEPIFELSPGTLLNVKDISLTYLYKSNNVVLNNLYTWNISDWIEMPHRLRALNNEVGDVKLSLFDMYVTDASNLASSIDIKILKLDNSKNVIVDNLKFEDITGIIYNPLVEKQIFKYNGTSFENVLISLTANFQDVQIINPVINQPLKIISTNFKNENLDIYNLNKFNLGTPSNYNVIYYNGLNYVYDYKKLELKDLNDIAISNFEFRVNSFTSYRQISSKIISLDDGGYIVTWLSARQNNSNYEIYLKKYNKYDVSLIETKADDVLTSIQNYNDISVFDNGDYIISWISDESNGVKIKYRKFNINNNPYTINSIVSNIATSPLYTKCCVLKDSSYIITWTDLNTVDNFYYIYFIKYGVAGSLIKSKTKVNDIGSQVLDSISSLEDGGFIVTWSLDTAVNYSRGIYLQRYNSDCTKNGTVVLVSDNLDAHYYSSSCSAEISNNRYIVVWCVYEDANTSKILFKIFNSDNTVYSSGVINQYITGNATHPSICKLTDGNLLITWVGGHVNDNLGILARKLSPIGEFIGDEFLVNQVYKEGSQYTPDCCGLKDGGFIISWNGTGEGDINGIFAKRYKADGSVINKNILKYLSGKFSNTNLVMEQFSDVNLINKAIDKYVLKYEESKFYFEDLNIYEFEDCENLSQNTSGYVAFDKTIDSGKWVLAPLYFPYLHQFQDIKELKYPSNHDILLTEYVGTSLTFNITKYDLNLFSDNFNLTPTYGDKQLLVGRSLKITNDNIDLDYIVRGSAVPLVNFIVKFEAGLPKYGYCRLNENISEININSPLAEDQTLIFNNGKFTNTKIKLDHLTYESEEVYSVLSVNSFSNAGFNRIDLKHFEKDIVGFNNPSIVHGSFIKLVNGRWTVSHLFEKQIVTIDTSVVNDPIVYTSPFTPSDRFVARKLSLPILNDCSISTTPSNLLWFNSFNKWTDKFNVNLLDFSTLSFTTAISIGKYPSTTSNCINNINIGHAVTIDSNFKPVINSNNIIIGNENIGQSRNISFSNNLLIGNINITTITNIAVNQNIIIGNKNLNTISATATNNLIIGNNLNISLDKSNYLNLGNIITANFNTISFNCNTLTFSDYEPRSNVYQKDIKITENGLSFYEKDNCGNAIRTEVSSVTASDVETVKTRIKINGIWYWLPLIPIGFIDEDYYYTDGIPLACSTSNYNIDELFDDYWYIDNNLQALPAYKENFKNSETFNYLLIHSNFDFIQFSPPVINANTPYYAISNSTTSDMIYRKLLTPDESLLICITGTIDLYGYLKIRKTDDSIATSIKRRNYNYDFDLRVFDLSTEDDHIDLVSNHDEHTNDVSSISYSFEVYVKIIVTQSTALKLDVIHETPNFINMKIHPATIIPSNCPYYEVTFN